MTNLGSYVVDHAVVDVTDLTNTGGEPLSTWAADSDVDNVDAAIVAAQEDESLSLFYDHLDNEIKVKNLSDGTDVNSGTDIGEVLVRFVGRY